MKEDRTEEISAAAVRRQLEKMAEPKYREFSQKLLPGTDAILGVRLPRLREMAKQIAKGDWEAYLKEASDESMEELMLQGMTIGFAPGDFQKKEPYLNSFIPKIDNWSVCDSSCAAIKLAKRQPREMWGFLQKWLHSGRTYEVRFGLVQLLDYYVNQIYLQQVLDIIEEIHHEDYYVKMAQAWALSICYREFPKETLPFLLQNRLDDFTHNKAIQKMTESRKAGKEEKEFLRTLKRT